MRRDRELMELLTEVRVALPGVQVLFAFLLAVPFSPRFARLSPASTRVYFATILLTAISTALLMAPSAHHRMRFRRNSKEQLIRVANRMILAGMALLGVATGTTMYVVSDLLYATVLAKVLGGAVAAATLLLWFGAPLLYGTRRASAEDRPGTRRAARTDADARPPRPARPVRPATARTTTVIRSTRPVSATRRGRDDGTPGVLPVT